MLNSVLLCWRIYMQVYPMAYRHNNSAAHVSGTVYSIRLSNMCIYIHEYMYTSIYIHVYIYIHIIYIHVLYIYMYCIFYTVWAMVGNWLY